MLSMQHGRLVSQDTMVSNSRQDSEPNAQQQAWQLVCLNTLALVCRSLRLRDPVTSATSAMSPETPSSAVRLRVSKAESEVAIARV